MPNIKPKFEVHELEGDEDHVILESDKDDDGKHLSFKEKVIKRARGWMVYFPNGSSIKVSTLAQMKHFGFDQPATAVDMDSGDVVGRMSDNSLKSHSEQKSKSKKRTEQITLEE